jgi:hypothetical protein
MQPPSTSTIGAQPIGSQRRLVNAVPFSSQPIGDHLGHIVSRYSHGIACEVGIARRSLHLRVSRQLADHRQPLA